MTQGIRRGGRREEEWRPRECDGPSASEGKFPRQVGAFSCFWQSGFCWFSPVFSISALLEQLSTAFHWRSSISSRRNLFWSPTNFTQSRRYGRPLPAADRRGKNLHFWVTFSFHPLPPLPEEALGWVATVQFTTVSDQVTQHPKGTSHNPPSEPETVSAPCDQKQGQIPQPL